ncbi:MAG: hypothetical protein AAFR87_27865 [Bacteroidota bacterium]
MTEYILKFRDKPEIRTYGTAPEIWEYCQEIAYRGETRVVDGYPLPSGENISLEKALEKKTGAIRITHKSWHQIEEAMKDKDKFKTQASVIEYGLKALKIAEAFGPVYASTPEGIKEFPSLIELMILKPYFDAVGFVPVISQQKEALT